MAWQQSDRDEWFRKQVVQRSYAEIVLARLNPLRENLEVLEYGSLSLDPAKYPLFMLKSKGMDTKKPTVLITGGVHGYETSGVLGAIAFFEGAFRSYAQDFNFVCFPCISPWAFETVNRWNNKAVDPNRSFYEGSPAEECQFFLSALQRHKVVPHVHIDLHETTDTDETVFRPALAARDGLDLQPEAIPDGFYLVGATGNPQPKFQKAMIDAVRKVTHIAPPDEKNEIIGAVVEQDGVINYDVKKLHLCAGATSAEYVTTTEVYPDSPRVTPQNCIDAQVAAIRGGLDFVRGQRDR